MSWRGFRIERTETAPKVGIVAEQGFDFPEHALEMRARPAQVVRPVDAVRFEDRKAVDEGLVGPGRNADTKRDRTLKENCEVIDREGEQAPRPEKFEGFVLRA